MVKTAGLLATSLLTALAGLLFTVPSSAAAADLVPTAITLTGPASARITTEATVTATLTETPADAAATPLDGRPVEIDRWNGTSWVKLVDVTTASDGTVSVPVKISGVNQPVPCCLCRRRDLCRQHLICS